MAKGKFAQSLLDMAESARMARAKEMGFMTKMPLYHGTNQDIAEFSLERGGEVSRSPVGKLGVSLATDPDTASEFANQAGSEGANVIQAYHRASKPVRIELDGTETNMEVAATVQDAWDQGFDAIKFDNYTTPKGEKGRSFVLIRDPNQIRSVNAAFDPQKKDSANLLASALPAAIGIGAAVKNEDAQAAFREPKGEFAKQLLAKWIAANPVGALAQAEFFAKDVGSIQAPKHQWALDAAKWFRKYNEGRGERLAPAADAVLPAGELPAELMEKAAYGDDISYLDALKAELGLL